MNKFQNISNYELIKLIEGSVKGLIYAAPGLTVAVANALIAAANRLGTRKVWILIDLAPTVIRLGYGELEALSLINQNNLQVFSVNNLRSGFFRNEVKAVIFTPISSMLEDDLGTVEYRRAPLPYSEESLFDFAISEKPLERLSLINGVNIDIEEADRITISLMHEAIEVFNPSITLDDLPISEVTKGIVTNRQMEVVKKDIESHRPVDPTTLRKLRILNSRFQFVEIEFKGSKLSQRKFSLTPKDIGIDPSEVGDNLSGIWKILGPDIDKETKALEYQLNNIKKTYLVTLPSFGQIIMGEQRPEFDQEMEKLQDNIKNTGKSIEAKVENLLKDSASRLKNLMVSSYQKNPPAFISNRNLSQEIKNEEIENFVNKLIKKKFPTAESILSKMGLDWKIFNISEQIMEKESFSKAVRDVFHVDVKDLVQREDIVVLEEVANYEKDEESWY